MQPNPPNPPTSSTPATDDDLDLPQRRFEGYRTPEVLAPAGFALAVASLLGFGVLNGSIVLILAAGDGAPSTAVQVAAGLLGAALAAIPFILGLEAVRHLLADDPVWLVGLSRATVLLGAIVVILRLLQTLAQAIAGGSPYVTY